MRTLSIVAVAAALAGLGCAGAVDRGASTSSGATTSAAGATSGDASGSGSSAAAPPTGSGGSAASTGSGGASGSSTGTGTGQPPTTVMPQTLGIVINTSDPQSVQVAASYQAARGIPAANLFALSFPKGTALDATTFAGLKAALDADAGSSIQAFALTWTFPYMVEDDAGCQMSITSAFALGFDSQWCVDQGVRCGPTAPSPYYASTSKAPFTDLGIRPTMMLAGRTAAEVSVLIARGVAADGTHPIGEADLVITTDPVRSVRAPEFRAIGSAWDGGATGVAVQVVDNSQSTVDDGALIDAGSVLIYLVGLGTVPGLDTNQYLPGALGDSLTSFGGVLGGAGQTTVLDWLAAGLTASSGTVREPCNYVAKFSNPEVLLPAYRGGNTLVEAYWKSVQWPGELLFVGEPLARPWTE